MKYNVAILLLLLPYCSFAFLDYNTTSSVSCNINPQEHNYMLHQIELYVFLIMCPICFVCILLITIIFIVDPKTRQMPGDIMLMLSISDMCLLGTWFSTSLYYYYNGSTPMPDFFCDIQSFFGIVGGTGQFVYNCIFCLFMIFQIKVGIKGKSSPLFRQIVYHGVAISIIGFIVILTFVTGQQGLSIYGTCSIKSTETSPYFGIALVLVYFFLATWTTYYFAKQVPNVEAFKKYRNSFLVYYNQYIKCTVVIWGILSVSNLIITVNCKVPNPIPQLGVFISVGNIAKLATPIVLTIVRYKNPSIKPTIDRLAKRIFCFWRKKPVQGEAGYKQMEADSSSEIQMNWFNQITANLRSCQIYTILVGIRLHMVKTIQSKMIQSNPTKDIYLRREVIELQDFEESQSSQFNIMHMKMTVYCPQVFQQFLQMDGFNLEEIYTSLSIEENKELIKEESRNDGGASGQFFLFSFNNKIIIKTLSQDELEVFLERLPNFHKHYKLNKDSLITKIYGLFTFTWISSAHPKIHILITKNIHQTKKNNILSIYDLKGSTFNREVLNQKKKQNFRVLKDVDFDNIEKAVHISPQQALKYRSILTNDSMFFRQNKIIDYSLIIVKMKNVEEGKPNRVGCTPSNKEYDVIYKIGIIDYLQLWNNKKRLQMATKKLINADLNLDTSAQDPIKYSSRFILNLVNKIFLSE